MRKIISDHTRATDRAPRVSAASLAMWLFFGLAAAMLFWLLSGSASTDVRFNNESILELRYDWSVTYRGDVAAVSLPHTVKGVRAGELVTFTTVLENADGVYNSLLVHSSHEYLRVYLNGVEIGSRGYAQHTRVDTAPYNGWLHIRLPDDWRGQTLEIETVGYYDSYGGVLTPVYLGTKAALLFLVIKDSLPYIYLALIFLVASLSLIFSSLFQNVRAYARQLRYLGVLGCVVTLWITMESVSYQLFHSNSALAGNLTLLVFQLLPIALSRFFLTMEGLAREPLIRGSFVLSCAGFLLIQVLRITGLSDYLQSNIIVQISIAVNILALVICYFSMRRRKVLVKDHYLYVSTLLLAAFSSLDLVRYYLGSPWQDFVLFTRIGLFLYMIALGVGSLRSIETRHMDEIQRQTLTQIAFTDILTGISNRNAFEEALTRYATLPDVHPILMIADLNYLKHINDTFGHRQGDNAICQVALALGEQFGKAGKVFRIGGDEFCVISESIEDEDFELRVQNLRQQVAVRAAAQKLPLALACGWVRENGDGVEKAFIAADRRMYADKQRMKSAL